jgi:hypothetical protein
VTVKNAVSVSGVSVAAIETVIRSGGGSGMACYPEGKEGPAEISGSVRRNLGRSWGEAKVACCCRQRWKETRRFPDRQVSTKRTEKAQVEALALVTMALIAQIALGVIIGGVALALLVGIAVREMSGWLLDYLLSDWLL